MKEKIITFETAKLAKEKGFNEICEYGYFDRDDEIILDISDHNNSDNLDISAPTQALLQKWLREIHGIIISINYNHEIKKYCATIEETYYYEFAYDWYLTYEEALEKGLLAALKL